MNGFLTRFIATHAGILTSGSSTESCRLRFDLQRNAPLPDPGLAWEFTASAPGLSPENYRRGAIRPVSSYALFKWWLLLSQHPGCLSDPTSLAT